MKGLGIILFLCPAVVFAQPAFRPVIDTTVTCAFEKSVAVTRTYDPDAPDKFREKIHLDLFYIVEQMPVPEMKPRKLEEALSESVQLNEQATAANGTMYFQCVVNCRGKADDFQIIHCPDACSNVCFQVFDILRNRLVEWQPGKQMEREVDVVIMIVVTINQGKFNVTAPFY